MTSTVQMLGDDNFEATVGGSLPVFVDFWAPWCGPCRIVGPIVEELASDYAGRAVVAKLNVDEGQAVAQRLGISSIPTMMMFKHGKPVDRMLGAAPKSALQAFIDRNL